MFSIFKFIFVFLALTGAAAIATVFLDVPFGNQNFWNHHGILFLAAITAFPRLTLLFSSVATGGLIWWVGFIFAPRILVAMLATVAYWNQNPILVVLTWCIALGGESTEKYVVVRQNRRKYA